MTVRAERRAPAFSFVSWMHGVIAVHLRRRIAMLWQSSSRVGRVTAGARRRQRLVGL